MEAQSIINQKVSIEAKVTVEPDVSIGDVQVRYVGEPHFKKCGTGAYIVSQLACIQFPLSFSATASAKPQDIDCRIPDEESVRSGDESARHKDRQREDSAPCGTSMQRESTERATYSERVRYAQQLYRLSSNPPGRDRCGAHPDG